jgi:hypothetical protein
VLRSWPSLAGLVGLLGGVFCVVVGLAIFMEVRALPMPVLSSVRPLSARVLCRRAHTCLGLAPPRCRGLKTA